MIAGAPRAGAPRAVGFGHLLHAEWTKLRSLRSTFWSLTIMTVLTVSMTVLATALTVADWDTLGPEERRETLLDPIGLILQPGVLWGQLAVAVLGVMVIAGEYSSGTIRAGVLAVPRRTPLLAAKGVVFAAVVFALGELTAFAEFFAGRAVLRDRVPVSLGDPGVLRAVCGVGLYLAVMGLFALAIGALIRHVAGAIAGVLGIVVVLSTLTMLLPGTVGEHIDAYLPGNAGRALLSSGHDPEALLTPWQGFGVMCLWTAALLTAAGHLLKRRDT